MKNIFISYQAKDTAISHLFFNALEDKGYDVWLYEEHGYCGIFHRNQVQQVIRESSAFIFIMSENSMLSDEVTFELQTADKENKPIFPVYINRCWEDFLKIKTDWRSILQSRTGINASHDLNKAIDSLVIGLKNEGVLGKSKNHQDNIQQDTSSDRERIVPVVFSGSLDHFINRTNELEMLMNFINDANTRFILLTGPGGYGKSAVIEKLICEITEHYSLDNSIFKCGIDSIVWLDFRAEENRSVDALFNLLNKTFSKGKAIDFINAWNSEPSLSHRLNFLIGRLLTRDKRLIILDNFESILDNTTIGVQYKDINEFIQAFMEIDHTSIIIATSQRSPTLSDITEGKHGGKKKEIIMNYGLPENEAVNLIIKLDEDGICHIEKTDKNLLIEVVRKLDCVPRTLELLMGRLKNDDNNIQEFSNEKEFYDLIANPTRELIKVLKKEQKQAIEVLSVLNRPETREAINFFFPELNLKNLLISLKKCFAVKVNENKQYYLHSTIQKIVYDQITEDFRVNLHKKAADWYASQHIDQTKWLCFDNVQSFINEIQHRIKAKEYNRACEALNLIDREYLAVWNYYSLMIQLRHEMMDKITEERLNELNIGNLGCAYLETNRTVEAKEYYIRALEISRKMNNPKGECRWLGNLAVVESILSGIEKAEKMMEEAYQLAKKCNDLLHVERWQGKLANMKRHLNILSIQDTILELEDALKTSRLESVHDKRFEAYWLHDLHYYYHQLKDDKIAAGYLDEAIEVADSIGNFKDKAEYLIESFNLKCEFTNPLQVVDSVERAFELKLRIGRQEEAYQLGPFLADFYLSYGIANKALEKYRQMLEFSREVGNSSKELSYLYQIGLTFYMNGDFKECISSFLDYKKRAIQLQLSTWECHAADFNVGDAYLQLLELENAFEYLQMSLGHGDSIDFIAHFDIAIICLKNKNSDDVDNHFNLCFQSYLKLAENNEVTHQFDFIYAIILVLRNKTEEAIEKIQTIFKDKSLKVFTLKMALHDIRLTKKILPEYNDIDKLEELLNNKIKMLNEGMGPTE